jgi:hypothetical protein
MKPTGVLLIVLLIIGFGSGILGYTMMERREPIGIVGELWLQENSILEPNSVRLAWGVHAPSEQLPDGWIFQIHLKANGSVWLRSIWYETNQVFYEWHGSTLEDTVTINVDEKTSKMEWTWYLYNPSSTTIMLYTIHVRYSGVRQPLRPIGIAVILGGTALVAISSSNIVRSRHHTRGKSFRE